MEKKKILIVEDEKMLLDLYASIFLRHAKNMAFDVVKAENADRAIQALTLNTFDLLLTDYHLPTDDGISLIKRVKEKTPLTASILISGYLTQTIVQAAIDAGAYTCLKKPCSITTILATVEKALEQAAVIAVTEQKEAPPHPLSFQIKSILENLPTAAIFIDDALNVLSANTIFTAGSGDPRGKKCHQLLYNSPTPCTPCPLWAGRCDVKTEVDLQLPGPEPGVEQIEPWLDETATPVGYIISLVPKIEEEKETAPPDATAPGTKDFFFLALDQQGNIVFADDHFISLIGLGKDEILNRPITDFLFSYFMQYLAKQEIDFPEFASLNQGKQLTLDFISGQAKERRPLLCEFIIHQERLPRNWEVMVIGMDMGKRLELNRLIQFERESLRQLRAGQFDMVITVDKDLVIKTINTTCLAKLKARQKDLVGADFRNLLAKPRDREVCDQALSQARSLKDVFNLRLDLSWQNRVMATLVNINAVRDSFNDEIGYVFVLRDIERQLKMEATLRSVERMQALGQLAAGTAHQINNYTNTILGSSDLLHECIRFFLPDNPEACGEALGFLKIIQESIQKLTALTQHLTAFARAQQPPVISAGDVNKVIRDISALIGVNVMRKSVKLDLRLDDKLPSVCFSPLHLEQAILNIIMNAIDAVEAKKGTIIVSSFRDPDWVCVKVEDNGPGIAEEIKGQIFEAFVTTKPEGVGTGLGLNVARDVIDSLKGVIEVDSSAERGTSMTVKIPIIQNGGMS